MVLIALAAIPMYYAAILFGLHWEVPSQLAVAKQVDEWVRRTSAKDRRDGSIGGFSGRGIHWELHGSFLPSTEIHTELLTRAGQKISITASIGAWPGRRLKRVSLSSMTRTLELPPEIVERGDLVDLQILIPEAFR